MMRFLFYVLALSSVLFIFSVYGNQSQSQCANVDSRSANQGKRYKLPEVFSFYSCQSEMQNRHCSDTLDGDVKVRTRYQSDLVEYDETYAIEQQMNICNDGAFEGQNGDYTSTSCQELPDFSGVKDAPLVEIDEFKYRGGFRISIKKYGVGVGSSVDFSQGQFTLNPKNKSIFMIGHPHESAVAEFKLPEIVDSTKIEDFKIAEQLIQPFTKFYKTKRVDTGINGYFRVTGMELIDGGLMINYINWYDANGTETDTSVFFKDASNLTSSVINGPYQLTGAAHAAGWLSAIPAEWQSILGGSHISGSQSGASISSRLSLGPSAFAINPADSFFQQKSGALEGIQLLDFSLNNILYDKSVYDEFVGRDDILSNFDGKNDLWTSISGAAYGFIIPGTSTYLTVGRSGGHKSGVGYKIVQDDGRLCGGSCAYSASDYSSYYWLWDVKELVKVKLGLRNSFDVRPYAYGEFPIPMDLKKAGVNSGYFDPESKLLYLSIPNGDTTGTYGRPPLMLVYKFEGL